MNTDTYTELLANPQSLGKAEMGELTMVIDQYPYFQSARALQLKGYKNENSFLYNDALKITAAYTTDRDVLFEYITSEIFVQNEISELILQQNEAIKGMDVVIEDVSELTSLELAQQMKAEMQKAEAILNPMLFERKETPSVKISEEKEEKEETIPEIETNEPLQFSEKDTYSFAQWLQLTQAKPIQRNETTAPSEAPKETQSSISQEEKERKFELIEKFIQERPKILPKEPTQKSTNLAKPYTSAPDTLMTETLAKVYLQQNNYKKAIKAYEILILKNPEKSGFFADQIRAIKKLIKTEEQ